MVGDLGSNTDEDKLRFDAERNNRNIKFRTTHDRATKLAKGTLIGRSLGALFVATGMRSSATPCIPR